MLKYGTLEVKYMIRSTLLSLKELLTGGLGVKDLSGPVGVVDAIGSTYEASKSEGMLTIWVNMLYMAAHFICKPWCYEPASASCTGWWPACISDYRGYPEKTGEQTD